MDTSAVSMTSLDNSVMSVSESFEMQSDACKMEDCEIQGATGQVSSSAGVSSQLSSQELSDSVGGAHNNDLITKNPIKFNLKSSIP